MSCSPRRLLVFAMTCTSLGLAGPAFAGHETTQPQSADAAADQGSTTDHTRRFCIFDPNGAEGLIYQAYDRYVVQARQWGYQLKRQPYSDEAVLANDFRAGRCDMAAMTGFRALEFVKFAGSLDMAGGLRHYSSEKQAVAAMSSDKAAPYMSSNGYTVAGILPLGKAYLFSRQRQYLTAEDGLVGKKIAVLKYDKQASTIANAAGAAPVPASISSFGNLFNNGAVDMAYAPATAYRPFELAKGMGRQGGVSNFVLGMVSDQLLIHTKRFTAGFGAASRHWTFEHLYDSMLSRVKAAEQQIPDASWVQLSPERADDYQQMIRDAREKLWAKDWYSHRMQHLLKQIRCANTPSAAECTAQSEGGAIN